MADSLPSSSGSDASSEASSSAASSPEPSPTRNRPPRLPSLKLGAALAARPAAPRSGGGGSGLDVALVSPAFALMPGSAHDWAARCAARLGVAAPRLRFLAATEVGGVGALPPGCERVLVEVADSGLSLQALEDVLQENARLCGAGGCSTAGPGTLGGLQDELSSLRQQVAQLQADKDSLRRAREQLRSSELLRQRSHKALRELRQEFEGLMRELRPGLAKRQLAALGGGLPAAPSGSPAALQDGLIQTS